MNELFLPAMLLMDRLRFHAKFSVLFVIVLIPLVVMAGMLIREFQGEVHHLEKERKGLAYVKILRLPIEHIQQHRGMTSAYKNGAEQFKNRILAKRQDIDADFNELMKIDAVLSVDLKTSAAVGNLMNQWQSIKNNSFDQDWPTTLKAHNALISDILALFEHVANTSEIILDSKLDSNHLGNAVTEVLPQLIEYMGQARATATGVAASGSLNAQTLPRLLMLMSNIDNYKVHLDKGLKLAADENAEVDIYLADSNKLYQQSLATMLNMLQQQIIEANPIAITSDSVFNTATNAIAASFQLYSTLIDKLDQLLSERSRLADYYLMLVATGALLLVLIVVYLLIGLSMSVNRSVLAINTETKRLAANDFTARISIAAQDEMAEIARSFNTMTETLSGFVRKIIDTSLELQNSAREVYEVAHETALAVERQRQETAAVAVAINQMSATIHDVAKTTSHAADAAHQADTQASQSRVVVSTASTSIFQLAGEIDNAARVIQNLQEDSKSIGTLLDVIKSISEQTNLLALNAAIEAARAGEQGRGFAVVADEVRTLASRTHDSTSVIEKMITKLQNESRDAVTVMQKSCQQAHQGVKHTEEAMRLLETIMASVGAINGLNIQIAGAAEEQSAVTEEINRNIIHISDISAKTATVSENTKNAANNLQDVSQNLQSLIQKFKIH